MSDILESAIAAMRADAPTGNDDDLADATRARLVRSLEVRAKHHRQLVAIVATFVVLLGGTGAWAWSTGRLQQLFAPAPPATIEEPAPSVAPAPAPQRATESNAPSWPSAPAEVPPPPKPAPVVAPPPAATPAPTPAPKPVPPPKARPALAEIETLYRKAHQLHFHGEDRAAALAAWDAYLAAEPMGRFSIEARFNRAIVLVRLGRYAEALAALEPFARGDVAGGYRREEAAQLVERLRPLVAGEGSAMAAQP